MEFVVFVLGFLVLYVLSREPEWAPRLQRPFWALVTVLFIGGVSVLMAWSVMLGVLRFDTLSWGGRLFLVVMVTISTYVVTIGTYGVAVEHRHRRTMSQTRDHAADGADRRPRPGGD